MQSSQRCWRLSTKSGTLRKQLGNLGEAIALQYVQRTLGWRVLLTNWRCRAGELDLVAMDGDCVVLVEVRTRSSNVAGTSVESVDPRKVRQLRRLSEYFVRDFPQFDPDLTPVRFDVIGLTVRDGTVCRLEHIRNAIQSF
jgi:putative endonuclease